MTVNLCYWRITNKKERKFNNEINLFHATCVHTGYTGTSIWIDPARELLAILLTNRVHPDRAPERIPEMNRVRATFHDIAARA